MLIYYFNAQLEHAQTQNSTTETFLKFGIFTHYVNVIYRVKLFYVNVSMCIPIIFLYTERKSRR